MSTDSRPYRRQVICLIDPHVDNRLDEFCAASGMSRSAITNQALAEWLARELKLVRLRAVRMKRFEERLQKIGAESMEDLDRELEGVIDPPEVQARLRKGRRNA